MPNSRVTFRLPPGDKVRLEAISDGHVAEWIMAMVTTAEHGADAKPRPVVCREALIRGRRQGRLIEDFMIAFDEGGDVDRATVREFATRWPEDWSDVKMVLLESSRHSARFSRWIRGLESADISANSR